MDRFCLVQVKIWPLKVRYL